VGASRLFPSEFEKVQGIVDDWVDCNKRSQLLQPAEKAEVEEEVEPLFSLGDGGERRASPPLWISKGDIGSLFNEGHEDGVA